MNLYYWGFISIILYGNAMLWSAGVIRGPEVAVLLHEKMNKKLQKHVLLRQIEPAEVMLWAGANVNFAGEYDITLLMCACINNDPEMVRLLLNHKANVRMRDTQERTALMHAVQFSDCAIVKMLVDHGAFMWDRDIQGKTPLIYAVLLNKSEALDYLLADLQKLSNEPVPPGIEKQDVDQLLMFAVRARSYKNVELLLKYGVDPNGKALKKKNPLVFAFQTGQADICRLLTSYRADVSCLGPHKRYSFKKS